MRKTVDVFIKDRLIASYPVVVPDGDRPVDGDYIDQVKDICGVTTVARTLWRRSLSSDRCGVSVFMMPCVRACAAGRRRAALRR